MTRAQADANRRRNFAYERIAAMDPAQRATVTADRLMASFGITEVEAVDLLRKFGRN